MSRVAEALETDDRERISRMSPAERVRLALSLGHQAIHTYAAAHGIERGEARRCLERAAQAGRRPSRVMREIIG